MKKTNRKYIIELAKKLRAAERMGSSTDDPQGSRFIQLSDTLTKEITDKLFKIIKEEGGL